MKKRHEKLGNTKFDVAIIGAGISGSFLAWELSRRGVRVALIEKGDFGGFTSASSSKLLHGGIRYLQQFKLNKVYESASERARFLNFAPNISKYVPFVVPTFNTGLMKSRLALQAGMMLYDLISLWPNKKIADHANIIPSAFFLNKSNLINNIPVLDGLPGLTGGQIFYEAHMQSTERMTLTLVKAARSQGATILNYAASESFRQTESDVTGLNCLDVLTGDTFTIDCSLVVNAAGPLLPQINKQIGAKLHFDTTGYSKGMHLVTKSLESTHALALVTGMKSESKLSRGGRHIFIIPWRGRSLIGTTNVPFSSDDLFNVSISEDEIADFIDEINSALPNVSIAREDVSYAFAGLYPLISDEVRSDTYQGTGEYQIIDHEDQDGIDGLVSMMGAKFTTAGKVANLAMEVVMHKLGLGKPKKMDDVPNEWLQENLVQLDSRLKSLAGETLPPETIDHLITNYGFDAQAVIQSVVDNATLAEPLAPQRDNILAELYYCLDQEMLFHLDDFIFRRTGLGTIGHPGQEYLEKCADIMASHLGWQAEKKEAELARVEKYYQYEN